MTGLAHALGATAGRRVDRHTRRVSSDTPPGVVLDATFHHRVELLPAVIPRERSVAAARPTNWLHARTVIEDEMQW